MELARRLGRLGTETAFAVAATAADWSSRGNEVFPFHLGDLNLPTPSNVSAAMQRAVAEGRTATARMPALRRYARRLPFRLASNAMFPLDRNMSRYSRVESR